MLPICDDWIKELRINQDKSKGLFELCHLLYCNQSACTNQNSLKNKISLLTSTIKQFKKVRSQLRQKEKKIKLKKNYDLTILINKVFNGFDLWYNVLKFHTLNTMIAYTRISKYWHQNTIQVLSHIRVKLIGKKDRVVSVHLWFSQLLHLDHKNKTNLVVLGLDDKINVMLKNLQLPLASPLPLTIDIWIQECKYPLERKWNLEWLTIYFYQFPDQINLASANGSRLIHWACQTGYGELVKMLLTFNQIDVNVNGADNTSTLVFAIQSQKVSIVKLLLEKKILINRETCCGKKKNSVSYPLHVAVATNQTELTQLLLDAGTNPFLLTNENTNAFDIANNYYRTKSYKLLIQNFIKLANKWNIKYTIEIRNRNEKEKLFFVIDEAHFYTIPASLGDGSVN